MEPAFIDSPDTLRDPTHRDLMEMNHRVANSLQLAAAYLKLQAQLLGRDSHAKGVLDAAAARVVATAELHRQICSAVDAATIDLSTYLVSLCAKIAVSTCIDVCFDGETGVVPVPVAHNVAQILTEVAINAAKHNPRHRGDGLLHVECRCEKETLRVVVRDAAVQERPADLAESSGGTGLSIVASIVRDLDGRIDVSWDNGIVFELTVPGAGATLGELGSGNSSLSSDAHHL